MPDLRATDPTRKLGSQSYDPERDRRTMVRSDTVLSRIEDATYAILRKHEKKPA
jgi:hypothetical protein